MHSKILLLSLTAIFSTVVCAFERTAYGQQWANDMFEKRVHDFGTVFKGSDVEFRFKLQNKYEEDIHISHVTSSCGCATPSIGKDTLVTWEEGEIIAKFNTCLLYTSPSPRDRTRSRMPSSA